MKSSHLQESMELKIIVLSEIGQGQKAKYRMFSLICGT
jgi:hypothetical protein